MDTPVSTKLSPLAAYRQSQQLTQEQAALSSGLRSKGYFSRLETGDAKAPIRLALQIENWSGGAVPAESLIESDDADLLRVAISRRAAAPAEAAA